MKNGDHIHRPDDGRGYRIVWLDGRQMQQVMLADTKKGKVVVLRTPLQLDKYRKRVLTTTLYGEVTVMFKDELDCMNRTDCI